MSKQPPRAVALPTIKFGGIEYVQRAHFDIASHAAQNNLQCVIRMQRDRDRWKAKAAALASLLKKRRR